MKLTVFVSALAWASIFVQSWLWILRSIMVDASTVGFYALFWILAIGGGLMSLNRK